MVWKRIMNKYKKSKTDTENHLTCDLMEQYLKELTLDLNLRLLCERQTLDVGELFFSERMLWVDNITVIAYEDAPQGSKFSQRIRDFLRIVWQIGQQPYP